MVKRLLSDFSAIINPRYQPTDFQPYLSMILSIVFVTIITFSIQTVTTTLHVYATNPIALKDTSRLVILCDNLGEKLHLASCDTLNRENIADQNTKAYLYSEQDLHNLIN
ncbi:MAG: hypothetical protein ACR2LN_04780 [Candidatus Levyibacteriota bacterium]